MPKLRGEAYEGHGYGRLRYELFMAAKAHIEKSLEQGYYCEAIAVIESVITDRLESRLSHLEKENVGFQTLGPLIKGEKTFEDDPDLKSLITELDSWRLKRNGAIHELVKVEEGKPLDSWDERIAAIGETAREGYRLLKLIYGRVADLNPLHPDRVF